MYQQIMLVGNLSGDPKMRFTQDGTPATSFKVVTNRSWRARDGTTQSRTVRFDVSARGRLAEVVNQYMTNGKRVLVVGEMEEPSAWTDREGNTPAREWDDGKGHTNMESCSKCNKRRYVHISRSKQAKLRIEYLDSEGSPTETEPPCAGTWPSYT